MVQDLSAGSLCWVSLLVDPAAQSYEFFVDDVKYESPDRLNFRGSPGSIYFLDYLVASEAWVDHISVTVPQPSSLIMLATGILALAVTAWRRRRRM